MGRGAADYRHFVMQKALIQKHFECFHCEFNSRKLTCTGEITPAEGCDPYTIRIDYSPGMTPKVWVLRPKIKPRPEIHMYREGCLCLYHPPEDPWLRTDNIHEKIIPWTAEWLVYYELYLLHGKWLAPEAPHK
ncbi:MAG: hypothetical protein KDN22_33175 [Verrucomicrobiae bacterium]|nr:hypothetical protein [Verrucomicrobiae bacterium]